MVRAIAIGFDGTLCSNNYPGIGEPYWEIILKAKAEKEWGSKLILWTCREGKLLEEAIAACTEWGLEFDAVNENIEEWKEACGTDPRKIGATEYWDDKSVLLWDSYGGLLNRGHVRELARKNLYMRKRLEKAESRILKLTTSNSFAPCDICTYNIKCAEKECPSYYTFKEQLPEGAVYNWDCRDISYGCCPVLEHTPCHNCNFENHFKWNGE